MDIEPWVDGTASDTLLVRARVSSPAGWININDHINYELSGETRGSRQVGHRKQEVTSPYINGSFVVNAVSDNIDEQVAVWVFGDSHYTMLQKVQALETAFTQLSYAIEWVIEDHAEIWDCQLADYTVNTQREFLHAKQALFTATVPRQPLGAASSAQVIPGTTVAVN
jgi:hypothetical protein